MTSKFRLAVLVFLVLLVGGMFMLNRTVVMPTQERSELNEDSLTTYLGKEVILDSTPHVLVSIKSINRREYTTDKGITVDYEFVSNYFRVRDSIIIDTNIIPKVDGTRVETKNGNE